MAFFYDIIIMDPPPPPPPPLPPPLPPPPPSGYLFDSDCCWLRPLDLLDAIFRNDII